MSIEMALADIQKKIRAASTGTNVELIAVSKTFRAEEILKAYDLGLRHFGENKVQELLEKQKQLPADIRWHMIGRLQTNKVKDLLGKTALIHSLDRLELFEKLEDEAKKKNLAQVECLLQVNISGEASKAGFAPNQIKDFLSRIRPDSPVKIRGLMTMAPWDASPDEIRNIFRSAKKLLGELKQNESRFKWEHLSMGMSGDFEIAVQEGSNMVRIGTALFGQREKE